MTPQERQMVADLFDRLASLEGDAPRSRRRTRDPRRARPRAECGLCAGAIGPGPGRGAQARQCPHRGTRACGGQCSQPKVAADFSTACATCSPGAAARSPRCGRVAKARAAKARAVLGARGPMPHPPAIRRRPAISSSRLSAAGYPQGAPMGGGMMGGHGGSFLGTAAATVAGVVGGAMLLNGIRSAFGGGGGNQAFGGGFGPSPSPWGGAATAAPFPAMPASATSVAHTMTIRSPGRTRCRMPSRTSRTTTGPTMPPMTPRITATTAAISVTAAAATGVSDVVGRARPSLLPPRLRGGPGWGSSSLD